jgi:hypothetical protein
MRKRIWAVGLSPAIHASLAQRRSGPVLNSATALGLILSCMSSAHADVFTVTSAGDPGATGLSLRQAIQENANFVPNSVIIFDSSLNGSTITLTQGEVSITRAMAIAGPGANKLTISGGNASRIFHVNTGDPVSPVTISGLTLTGGNAGFFGGGAIYAYDGSLRLQDSVISGNSGRYIGAISIGADHVNYYAKLSNLSIHGNSTAVPGHWMIGFFGRSGSLSAGIYDSTMSNNTGGAVYVEGKTQLDIERMTISGHAAVSGGAVFAFAASGLEINQSTIAGNSATGDGGALQLYDTPTTVHASVISGNSAGGNGGAVMMTGDPRVLVPPGKLTVISSTLSGNSAYDFGAGIDIARASGVYMYYSLVSNNTLNDFTSGANGGGLALQFVVGQSHIENSTFYQNFAYHSAGGVGIFDSGTGNNAEFTNVTIAKNGTFNGYSNGLLGAGQATVKNSIIANNSNSYAQTQDVVGSFKVNYSLIKNASAATITGSNNITNGTDPQLGPLTVNGGPTLTMLPAAASPVINAGSTTAPGIIGDQRFVPRLVGSHVDMGAVERQIPEVMIFRNGFDSP